MRALILCLLAGTVPLAPALAETRHATRPPPRADGGPKPLIVADDWTAATHKEGGQLVCYAFTKAVNSVPKISGRGDVVLTVAQRPGNRDAVAIASGYAYPDRAEVTLQADGASQPFYTDHRSAFARDGATVVAALQHARALTARGPDPRGTTVVDMFSTRGFALAYAAAVKACPVK